MVSSSDSSSGNMVSHADRGTRRVYMRDGMGRIGACRKGSFENFCVEPISPNFRDM